MKQNKILVRLALILGAAIILTTVGALTLGRERAADLAQTTFTRAEVEAADSPENCLVLIGDTVYRLTEYAKANPAIRPLCGSDATRSVERITTSTVTIFEPLKAGTLVEG